MPNNLDLAALIRCLEVMADENSWEDSFYGMILADPPEAEPWNVAEDALVIVRSILDNQNAHVPYGHDRISNQELKPSA